MLFQWLAVELLDDVPGLRPLDLEAPVLALHRLAHGAGGRSAIHLDLHVVPAGFRLEEQPVGGRRPAHVDVFVLFLVEEDAVADDVAGRGGGYVLLGPVHREVGHAVDGGVRDQLQGVGALDEEVVHVVRLVVRARRFPARRAVRCASWRIPGPRPDRRRPRAGNCAAARRYCRPHPGRPGGSWVTCEKASFPWGAVPSFRRARTGTRRGGIPAATPTIGQQTH